MKAIKVKVYTIDHDDDLVSGGVTPKLSDKPATIACINLNYLVETHMDPSGIFAYVNLSTGQVFTTSPDEYDRIMGAMDFERQP